MYVLLLNIASYKQRPAARPRQHFGRQQQWAAKHEDANFRSTGPDGSTKGMRCDHGNHERAQAQTGQEAMPSGRQILARWWRRGWRRGRADGRLERRGSRWRRWGGARTLCALAVRRCVIAVPQCVIAVMQCAIAVTQCAIAVPQGVIAVTQCVIAVMLRRTSSASFLERA